MNIKIYKGVFIAFAGPRALAWTSRRTSPAPTARSGSSAKPLSGANATCSGPAPTWTSSPQGSTRRSALDTGVRWQDDVGVIASTTESGANITTSVWRTRTAESGVGVSMSRLQLPRAGSASVNWDGSEMDAKQVSQFCLIK